MAKEKNLVLDGYYTHEGRPLEPGVTYTVSDNPVGEKEISEKAFDDLSAQMKRIQDVKNAEAKAEAERVAAMYGNEGVPGQPITHNPAGLSMEDVQRMLDEQRKQILAEVEAGKTDDTNTANANTNTNENTGENGNGNTNITGNGADGSENENKDPNAGTSKRTLNTGS